MAKVSDVMEYMKTKIEKENFKNMYADIQLIAGFRSQKIFCGWKD